MPQMRFQPLQPLHEAILGAIGPPSGLSLRGLLLPLSSAGRQLCVLAHF
jgi:hypothetical protein